MGKITMNGKDITKPFDWKGKSVTKIEYNSKTLTLQKAWYKWTATHGASNIVAGSFTHTLHSKTSTIFGFGNMSSDTGPNSEFVLSFFGSNYVNANHSNGWHQSNIKTFTVDPVEKEVRFNFRWVYGFQRADYTSHTWPSVGSGTKGETTIELKYDTGTSKWKIVGTSPAWVPGTSTEIFIGFNEGSGSSVQLVVNTDNSSGTRSAVWLDSVESIHK